MHRSDTENERRSHGNYPSKDCESRLRNARQRNGYKKNVRQNRSVKTKKRKGGIPRSSSRSRKPSARRVTKVKITKPVSTRQRVSSSKPNQARIALQPSVKKARGKAGGKKVLKEKIAPRPGKRIGVITHYFNKINVGVLKVGLPVKTGDPIEIRRKGLVAGQEIISSMQVNHNPITRAKRGDEIGLKLKTLAQKGDELYKL